MRHGIDLKTHSQCQRQRHEAAYRPNAGYALVSSWRNQFVAGGAYRDRTDDPLLAKQVLSQLS